jgi:hypothetical protein
MKHKAWATGLLAGAFVLAGCASSADGVPAEDAAREESHTADTPTAPITVSEGRVETQDGWCCWFEGARA